MLVVGICALVLAACGSSGKSGTSRADRSQFLAFSRCMRTHGVSNFPDPSANGGIDIGRSSGINPFSPAFRAAQSTCGRLLPGGGPGNARPTRQDEQRMLAIAECMRAHGVSGFPDPTTTPPSGITGYSEVLGRDGLFLAVPQTINTHSPAYQQAARTCRFR
jgi:hypothetical protein